MINISGAEKTPLRGSGALNKLAHYLLLSEGDRLLDRFLKRCSVANSFENVCGGHAPGINEW